jgi:hypothetical protein
MPQRRFRELRDVLLAAAARLSARLGYRKP